MCGPCFRSLYESTINCNKQANKKQRKTNKQKTNTSETTMEVRLWTDLR